MDLTSHRQRELRENLVGCVQGMVRRADKYLAQQHRKELPRAVGLAPTPSVFPERTAMPDDYLLAQEPLEFEYDSEETDPREPQDDPEEDDASMSSNSTYKSNGHDSDQTRRTNISNRNHRHNHRKGRNTGSDTPQMLRRKRIGGKAKWSCLYSETP